MDVGRRVIASGKPVVKRCPSINREIAMYQELHSYEATSEVMPVVWVMLGKVGEKWEVREVRWSALGMENYLKMNKPRYDFRILEYSANLATLKEYEVA